MDYPHPLLPASLVLLAACGGGEDPPPRAEEQAADPAPAPSGGGPQGPWLDPAAIRALPEEGPGLPDEAAQRGLDYVNLSGEPAKATILEANGAGVALLDLGADGDLDAVFGQGLESLAALATDPGARLEVFENDGAARFTRRAGPPETGWWTGLAAGDIDGDGATDLAAGGFGALLICLQEESGLRAHARLERPARQGFPSWFTSLALLDADLDGQLDLYAGRYLDLDPLDPPRGELGQGALTLPCWWKGAEVFCGPRGLTPQADRMFKGDGAGSFEDVTARWLPDHEPGFTLAVGASDADFDGDTDLYVANDSTANLMLVNEVRAQLGAFVDRALTAGVAFNPDGAAEAGMGVAFGDVDRDGRFDLAVTNFSDEPTHLYLSRERGFSNQTYRMGLSNQSRRLLSWSAHLVDLDGDGWLELFTANGHVYPQADAPDTGTRYAQPDTLWRLRPEQPVRRVLPMRRDSILGLARGTRGSAVGDLDMDGAPDLVLVAIDAPAALGMNRLAPEAQRLVLVLEGDPSSAGPAGRRSPRDGMGAKAILVPALGPDAQEFALLAEVQTAVGFQSASSPALYLATGAVTSYSQLTILWPSGRSEDLGPGAMGRRLTIREGGGVVAEAQL